MFTVFIFMFQYVVYRPILYLLSIGSLGDAVANARACRHMITGSIPGESQLLNCGLAKWSVQGSMWINSYVRSWVNRSGPLTCMGKTADYLFSPHWPRLAMSHFVAGTLCHPGHALGQSIHHQHIIIYIS